MNLLNLTLSTAAENLAADEALLELAVTGDCQPLLRLWEPSQHFVVLGYGNRVSEEVDKAMCGELAIPILRRTSGGGTVLQGPGCLNYSLILPLNRWPELESI